MRDNGIKKRQGISLVMIVKNEEEFLEYCLKSVAGLVNEIIIVDTGSTDASRDIAAKFGSRVFDFTWQDDFAAARNYGLEQARCEWILVLDADEHLEEPSAHMLLDLIDASGTADAYLLPVKNLMVPEFNEWQVSLILRLFRNSPDLRFQGTIHEQLIVPAGKRAEIAEDGPVIIHSGYAENNRKKKNRRNMRMLKKALEKDPDNPYLHYYISTEYILQGDFKTAWQYIDRALPRIPHDVILFRAALVRNAAVVLNELDNLELAEKLLLEEIKINPNFPDYHYFLANLYQKQDEHWLAVEHYNWAVTIDKPPLIGCSIYGSNGYKSLLRRGMSEEKLQAYFAAVNSFREALEGSPSFYRPLSRLMQCLFFLSGEKECGYCLSFYIDINISTPQMCLFLARLLFAGARYDMALQYANRAKSPDIYAEKCLLLGEIHLIKGDIRAAERYFKNIPPNSKFFAQSLFYRCLVAWKERIPYSEEFSRILYKNRHNRELVTLMEILNSVPDKERLCDLAVSDDRKLMVKTAKELFVKLLEFKIFDKAALLAGLVVSWEEGLRWELAFLCRQLTAELLPEADVLQSCTDNEAGSYLQSALVYEKLANSYIRSIPKAYAAGS